MIFQRAELHNHSTESDGSMTVAELMEWAEEKEYEVMALTDHNTCAGHEKAERIIREKRLKTELLKGVEVTTMYGHILVLGTGNMPDLRKLNPQAPEEYLKELRRSGGAAIGLAHPMCIGRPVMAGCRFAMELHDWDLPDYIEVFNTSAGTGEIAEDLMGNEKALELWETKVLQGHRLAAVTGKDIHRRPEDLPVMITYAVLPDGAGDENRAGQVLAAILEGRTIVTRGPLLTAEKEKDTLTVFFNHDSSYWNWNRRYQDIKAMLRIKDDRGNILEYPVDFKNQTQSFPVRPESRILVLRLYENTSGNFGDLLAAGIAVRQRGEENI